MRPHALASLALAFAITATTNAALADDSAYPTCGSKTPTKEESDHGHNLYIQGKVYYDDGDYNKAIPRFKEAYKTDCTKHELLVIISRSYELKGDKREALVALETYVERVPTSPDLQTHQNRIANLKAGLAAEKKDPPPPPPPSGDGAGATPPGQPPPPAGEARGHTVYPWIVVGVGGLVAAAGGVLFGVGIGQTPSDCGLFSRTCGASTPADPNRNARLTEEANAAAPAVNAGLGMLIGGVLVAGGGLVWHFVEPTGPSAAAATRLRVSPAVTPGYAGLGLSKRF